MEDKIRKALESYEGQKYDDELQGKIVKAVADAIGPIKIPPVEVTSTSKTSDGCWDITIKVPEWCIGDRKERGR